MGRTPESELLTSLILETFRLNGVLLDAGNKLTRPHNLTSARWQIMGVVGLDEQHPKTVAQISRRMGLTRQGVQRVVNDLVELGFVAFEENIDHKRAKLVRLTKTGSEALFSVQQDQNTWVNKLSEGMNEAEITHALGIMRTVCERLLSDEAD